MQKIESKIGGADIPVGHVVAAQQANMPPPRPWWRRLPNLCSLAIIALLLAVYITPFGDLDYAVLIRLGELIVQTGQLQPPESFSYTAYGTHVPDFEWLFQIVVWAIWSAFGYGGLKLLKVLLVGATLLLVGLRLRSEGVRWHGIALSLGLAVIVLAPGWNLRPLYFTTLGLLLVSWWLHDHCTGKRPLSWWLLPVMWVWANSHPGVITGQGLLLGAIVWEALNRWIKLNTPLDGSRLRRLALIGGLGLAVTFLSPAPIERLLMPFQPQVRHPIMRIYTEMQPLYQAALQPPFVYLLVYLLAIVVLLTVVLRFREYRLWEIALLTGTAALAMMAVRGVQDWVLIMLSLGVPHLCKLVAQASSLVRPSLAHQASMPAASEPDAPAKEACVMPNRHRFWVAPLLRFDRSCKRLLLSPAFRFQWFWPCAALALLAVVSLIPPLGRDMPLKDRRQDPTAAVNWIEQQTAREAKPWRIFAPPDYGTYLIWRLGDRVRCYIDTRGFSFPAELTEDGHYLPQLGPDWRNRLDKVLSADTEYFLLETTGPRGRLWHLLQQHHAEPLYLDEQAVLLTVDEVRKSLAREAGIENH